MDLDINSDSDRKKLRETLKNLINKLISLLATICSHACVIRHKTDPVCQ